LKTVVCSIECGTWSELKDFIALGLKSASARSLKMRQNIFMILTLRNFPFYQTNNGFLKKNTFARSKDPNQSGSGLKNL
jgi:hypothetical protein